MKVNTKLIHVFWYLHSHFQCSRCSKWLGSKRTPANQPSAHLAQLSFKLWFLIPAWAATSPGLSWLSIAPKFNLTAYNLRHTEWPSHATLITHFFTFIILIGSPVLIIFCTFRNWTFSVKFSTEPWAIFSSFDKLISQLKF